MMNQVDLILKVRRMIRNLDPDDAPTIKFIHGEENPLPKTVGILSASFNPMTHAHLEMALKAKKNLGLDGIVLLLAKVNVDKKVFGATLTDRALMLKFIANQYDRTWVAITNKGRFVDKAKAFRSIAPDADLFFIVGFDTLIRIFDSRYYDDPERDIGELFGLARLIVYPRELLTRVAVTDYLMADEFRSRFRDRIDILELSRESAMISSTRVRETILHGGDITGMVPEEIDRIITDLEIYTNTESYRLRQEMIEYLDTTCRRENHDMPGNVGIAARLMAVNSRVGRSLRRMIEHPLLPVSVEVRDIPRDKIMGDFDLVVKPMTEDQAVQESRRCLRCVNQPCRDGCPIGIPIRAVLSAVARKEHLRAYLLLRSSNPLFGLTAFLCQDEQYCRRSCMLGKMMTEECSVNIKAIFRFLWYWAVDNSDIIPAASYSSSLKDQWRVAIIGSGPAGLAAAWKLSEEGIKSTVFEREPWLGGVPFLETPRFRFPADDVIPRITSELALRGVDLKTNFEIGPKGKLSVDDLFRQGYTHLFIATGLSTPEKIGIPGEDLEGVIPAKRLLRTMLEKNPHKARAPFKGRRVVVIDAGNTAMDSARYLLRCGADPTIIFWRNQPRSLRSEYELALKEGVSFIFNANPVRISRDGDGLIVEVHRQIDGDHELISIPTDFVINAIGALPDDIGTGLKTSALGHIVVDNRTLQTSRDRIYAGGDVISKGNVTQAIKDGLKAASRIVREG